MLTVMSQLFPSHVLFRLYSTYLDYGIIKSVNICLDSERLV
jgi:hypothetical protein